MGFEAVQVKNAELLVLRHENAVLRRNTGRIRYEPGDRAWFNIALADRIRYHVNVYWENAPDRRTSRTPDWLNDACEARLEEQDRDHGKVTYAALMSPMSIAFTFPDAPSWGWRRPFAQANRAKLRPGKRQYTEKFPITLLVTDADRYVLLGLKKRLGRRAAVKKYKRRGAVKKCKRTDIRNAVKSATDDFHCTLHLSTGAIDVGFATKFEVDVLVKCLNNPESLPESESAAAKSGL